MLQFMNTECYGCHAIITLTKDDQLQSCVSCDEETSDRLYCCHCIKNCCFCEDSPLCQECQHQFLISWENERFCEHCRWKYEEVQEHEIVISHYSSSSPLSNNDSVSQLSYSDDDCESQ